GAAVLVEMKNGLGVAVATKHVAPGQQLPSQVAVVADLAVEYNCLGIALVEHRLIPARRIDDTEALGTDPDRSRHVHAVLIGSAVAHRGAHLLHYFGTDRPGPMPVRDPSDATHQPGLTR